MVQACIQMVTLIPLCKTFFVGLSHLDFETKLKDIETKVNFKTKKTQMPWKTLVEDLFVSGL